MIKVLILAGLCAVALCAQTKVVFVCEHGAAKSIIAATEFKRMAAAKGHEFVVVSRGTNPDAEVAAGVRQGLKEDGMDVGSTKPAMVSAKDLEGATRVITFGPDLSGLLPKNVKVLDWSATPAPSKDYKAARDYVRGQLEILLTDLERSK